MKKLIIIVTIINVMICCFSVYIRIQLNVYSEKFLTQIKKHRKDVEYFNKEVEYFTDKVELFSNKTDTLIKYSNILKQNFKSE